MEKKNKKILIFVNAVLFFLIVLSFFARGFFVPGDTFSHSGATGAGSKDNFKTDINFDLFKRGDFQRLEKEIIAKEKKFEAGKRNPFEPF
jgi:hypothetical protein